MFVQMPDQTMINPPGTNKMAPKAATNPPRLRRSCDACAASKCFCSREQPKCSRCAKRRTSCSYSAARRPGRVPNVESFMLTTMPRESAATSVSTLFMANPGLETTHLREHIDLTPQNAPAQPKPQGSMSHYWKSSFEDSLAFHSDTDMESSSPIDHTPDPDGLFAGVVCHSDDDFHGLGSTSYGSCGSDYTRRSLGNSDPTSPSSPASRNPTSSGNEQESRAAITASSYCPSKNDDDTFSSSNAQTPSSCLCLAQAISLCASLMDPTLSPPDISLTMALTADAAGKIRNMLCCSCNLSNGLSLTFVSLAIFQVTTLYATAAGAMSSTGTGDRRNDTYNLESPSQRRATLRVILAKLAGVQVLSEQLSQRLDRIYPDNSSEAEESNVEIAIEGSKSTQQRPPLSVELAKAVVGDLPRRLQRRGYPLGFSAI